MSRAQHVRHTEGLEDDGAQFLEDRRRPVLPQCLQRAVPVPGNHLGLATR